jgi:hypothetical protein
MLEEQDNVGKIVDVVVAEQESQFRQAVAKQLFEERNAAIQQKKEQAAAEARARGRDVLEAMRPFDRAQREPIEVDFESNEDARARLAQHRAEYKRSLRQNYEETARRQPYEDKQKALHEAYQAELQRVPRGNYTMISNLRDRYRAQGLNFDEFEGLNRRGQPINPRLHKGY